MSEAFDIALPSRQFGTTLNRMAVEEDRAWALLYASVSRASTAEEVVKQLDADAQARQSHLALYLRARTTLREQKAAEMRNQRIGAAVQCVLRSAVTLLIIGPVRLLRSVLSSGSGVAVGMLASASTQSAKDRVRTSKKAPAFARTEERFAPSPHWPM